MADFLTQLLDFILFEETGMTTMLPDIYMYITIINLLVTFIISVYILSRLVSGWMAAGKLRKLVTPVLSMAIGHCAMIFILLVNQILLFASKNQLQINVAFQGLFPYIPLFISAGLIVTRLVKVPKFRSRRINAIKILILLSILIAIFFGLFGYIPNLEFSLISYSVHGTINMTALVMIIIFLRKEGSDNSSKIGRLRIQLLSYGFLGLLVQITLGAMIVIINMFVDTPLFLLNYGTSLLFTITSIGTILAFYYSYFTPVFLRKRAGLFFDFSHFKKKAVTSQKV